jgi:hypothetical protein
MSPGPQLLFNRRYSLAILGPQGQNALQYGNIGAAQAPLRVAFEVEKTPADAANTGKIALFNLNRQVRAALGPGYKLQLTAGYEGLAEKIFIGLVHKVVVQRQGPDVVTSMECRDGQFGLFEASFNQDYPPGPSTKLAAILSDVAKVMTVDIGVVIGLPDESFPRGITLHGGCRDVLRKLLHKHGLEASVQNGKLNIIPEKYTMGTKAVVISQSTGMIGVPSMSGATNQDVSFDCLLNPKLVPAQMVQILSDSDNTSGFFKIRTAKYAGDSHDNNWQVSCECARIPKETLVTSLSPAQGFAFGSAVIPGLL